VNHSSSAARESHGVERGAVQTASPSKTGGAKISIAGTWSGVSNGEKIILKIGAGGSASLTNSGGANPGNWTSAQGPGRYSFTFGNRQGEFVLLDSRTATLTVMGSSIELRR
jgi:hypothetical protein